MLYVGRVPDVVSFKWLLAGLWRWTLLLAPWFGTWLSCKWSEAELHTMKDFSRDEKATLQLQTCQSALLRKPKPPPAKSFNSCRLCGELREVGLAKSAYFQPWKNCCHSAFIRRTVASRYQRKTAKFQQPGSCSLLGSTWTVWLKRLSREGKNNVFPAVLSCTVRLHGVRAIFRRNESIRGQFFFCIFPLSPTSAIQYSHTQFAIIVPRMHAENIDEWRIDLVCREGFGNSWKSEKFAVRN